MTDYDDPGWAPALRRSLLFVFLPAAVWVPRAWRGRALDGLTMVRILFLSFVAGLFLFLVVLLFITADGEAQAVPTWMLPAFAAVLLLSLGGVVWATARPLDVSTEEALAESYRTRFFLGIAFAESAALFGFVGVFLAGRLLPYLVGLAVSLMGFAMIAPSRANIERLQREITARGSTLSLGRALMQAPASGPLGG